MLSRFFSKRPSLLFVCTANLCRSPMAEGLCRTLIGDRDWEVVSAGFFVDRPSPPHEGTISVLEKRGIASDSLESCLLTPKLIRRATHIFTMTDMQLVSLRKKEPKAVGKSHLTTAFSTQAEWLDNDVPDPIDGGPEAFEHTYQILEDAMPQLILSVAREQR